MNTQSNAIPKSAGDADVNTTQAVAAADVPVTQRLYWSVLRELWESRSIYIAPLAVAALILFGFLISTIQLRQKMRAALTLDPIQQRELIAQPYNYAALLLMFTTFVVAVFYCLDALHGERRDRSILFWKSLPVSDLITVLAKASIPLLVLPVLTFAVTVVTQYVMLLVSVTVLLGSGPSAAMMWEKLPLFQMSLMLLYHLLAVHSLWYAPLYAWLLLVSAWARRVAFLWAALPVVAIAIVEKIAFNTTHFVGMLENRVGGNAATIAPSNGFALDPMTHYTPGHFLSSPGLWIGLVLAAAFLAVAMRLRRSQGPI
jgi:ABC-2 type transport system permease protein